MSQRLVNVVCMIFTLAAAVYLYVSMHEYSISGSDGGKVAEWEEITVEPKRLDVKPGTDARSTESLRYRKRAHRAKPPSLPLDFD